MTFTGSPEYDTNATDGDIGVTKSTTHLLSQAQMHLNNNQFGQFQICVLPFQELPQLIDAKLQEFVTQLAKKYTNVNSDALNPQIARALYTLASVRGSKVVARLLPNHVSNVIPVINLISKESSWEEEYIILLWLSTLARIPFPLHTIKPTLPKELYELGWSHLNTAGKSRDAAARLLGVLLTRDDMTEYLSHFYSDSCTCFSSSGDQFLRIGILQTLPHLIKFKTAEELKWYALDHQKLLYVVQEWSEQTVDANTHRLMVKNISRLAQLQMSLSSTEVPLEVEKSVGYFLSQLSHPNTLVRYTTSKAIARICQKLPSDLVSEVVDAVTAEIIKENISSADADKWHGVLLTLAEIIRRNLLPRKTLPIIYAILRTAIPFEQRQLTYSVGNHVRDASCYVCWSLFRTVPGLAGDDISDVVSLLIKVACFDRQINNRRAASAAVQEFVGRQGAGTFLTTVKGIDLLTKLDYFKLGSREESYLKVSLDMQNLGFLDLSDYVVEHCITSWDPEIRVLGARSLSILTKNRVSHVVDLLSQLDISETDVRHGVMLACSEIGIHTSESLDIAKNLLNYVTHSHLQVGQETFTAKGFVSLLGTLWRDSEDSDILHNLEKLTLCMEMNDPDLVEGISRCVTFLKLDKYSDIFSVWSQRLYETGYPSFARALGALPFSEVESCLSYVIQASKPSHLADCATKAACIEALSFSGSFDVDLVGCCLDNYTIDTIRGDVGKWVREKSLMAILKHSHLNWDSHIPRIVRISVENLDDLRRLAFDVLVKLKITSGPRQEDVGYFSQMLDLWDNRPEYRHALVSGLTSLAGAERANTRLLGYSFDSLSLWLVDNEIRTSEFVSLMLPLIDRNNIKLALAGLRLLSKFFDLGIFSNGMLATPDTGRPLVHEMFVKVYNMHINTSSHERLQCCIRVFGSLAVVCEELRKKVMDRLVVLLGHPSFSARIMAAEALAEVFSEIGLGGTRVDDFVLDTPWRDLDKCVLKKKQAEVRGLIGL